MRLGTYTNGTSLMSSPPPSRLKEKAPISATMLSPTISFAKTRRLASLATEMCRPFNHLMQPQDVGLFTYYLCSTSTLKFSSFFSMARPSLSALLGHNLEGFQLEVVHPSIPLISPPLSETVAQIEAAQWYHLQWSNCGESWVSESCGTLFWSWH